jgi:hypothetical protein
MCHCAHALVGRLLFTRFYIVISLTSQAFNRFNEMESEVACNMVTSSPKPLRTAGRIQNAQVQRKYGEIVCTLVWTDPLKTSSLDLEWHCKQWHISSAILHFSNVSPLFYRTSESERHWSYTGLADETWYCGT